MTITLGSPIQFLEAAQRSPLDMLRWVLPSMIVFPLCYAVFEGFWGRTPGKAICRLRVTTKDGNLPGFWRAWGRAAIYTYVPVLPYWIGIAINPNSVSEPGSALQVLLAASYYLMLAALFSTARTRNGFAAVHDLATGTRVISREALERRPILEMHRPALAEVENARRIGPYHVLQQLAATPETTWLLAYDLRLLRKIWVRLSPPGTPRVPAALRNLARVGRLRWLGDKRSETENWDAYEAPDGQSLTALLSEPQPWTRVRFWLHDLATELAAARKDGTTTAELGLDHVWISSDGRAKLLDFSAPTSEVSGSSPASSGPPLPFLSAVASAALNGNSGSVPASGSVERPLPLHARSFLDSMARQTDPEAIAAGLKPLLRRLASISRARRAAVVLGCVAAPVLLAISTWFSMRLLNEWNRLNPGLFELSGILQARKSSIFFAPRAKRIPDTQYQMFIAAHYRSTITNPAAWSSAFAKTLIKGDARKFAEESVAKYGDVSPEEIAEAETALKPFRQPPQEPLSLMRRPEMMVGIFAGMLGFYVGLPALLAALAFKGGLVLRIAGIAFVRADGSPAGRLRIFWRGLVSWSVVPIGAVLFALSIPVLGSPTALVVATALTAALAVMNTCLPRRGVPDRLAGTYLVAR
jgi:uncharacterized RDD family membrane protein YckC